MCLFYALSVRREKSYSFREYSYTIKYKILIILDFDQRVTITVKFGLKRFYKKILGVINIIFESQYLLFYLTNFYLLNPKKRNMRRNKFLN